MKIAKTSLTGTQPTYDEIKKKKKNFGRLQALALEAIFSVAIIYYCKAQSLQCAHLHAENFRQRNFSVHKYYGVDYATRLNWYNPLFWMLSQ